MKQPRVTWCVGRAEGPSVLLSGFLGKAALGAVTWAGSACLQGSCASPPEPLCGLTGRLWGTPHIRPESARSRLLVLGRGGGSQRGGLWLVPLPVWLSQYKGDGGSMKGTFPRCWRCGRVLSGLAAAG